MDQLNRLFGKWTEDLAPGIPNPSQVVKERIIYRSAEEKSLLPIKGFKGDSMDIDLNDFTMPLGEPQSGREHRKIETGARDRDKDRESVGKGKKSVKDIDRIGQIEKFKQIESINALESLE